MYAGLDEDGYSDVSLTMAGAVSVSPLKLIGCNLTDLIS